MVLEYFHYGISSFASLGVIAVLLAAGTIASIVSNRQAAAGAQGAAKHDASPLREVV